MNRDVTVEAERTDREAAPMGTAATATHGTVQPASDKAVHTVSSSKRKRSAGELVFDATAYGGISLLGNEMLGMGIMKSAKEGRLSKWYKPSAEWTKKLPLLKELSYVHTGRSNYLLWATISGTLLVLPVKILEDNKGKLVRFFDRKIHGDRDDPALAETHAEMEKAPRQTWMSLGEGRLITIGSALAVDSLIGWPAAPLAKLFDRHGKVSEYASFDRAATTLSRNLVGLWDANQKTINTGLKNETNVHVRFDTKHDTKAVKWLALGGSLLVLSTALTALFYASSKAFARGKEEKQERKEQRAAQMGYSLRSEDMDAAPEQSIQTEQTSSPKPTTRVAQVESLSRVSDPSMLQAGV